MVSTQKIAAGIDRILYYDWDISDVEAASGPRDECSAYVPRLVQMITASASQSQNVAYLDMLARKSIGLKVPIDIHQRVAAKLRSLRTV